MKKLFFICLMCILIATSCSPKLVPFIGANVASVNGDNADSFDSRIGINGGVLVRTTASDQIDVETGLVYSQQGADYSESMYSGKYKLDYLNIPIMARFQVADGFVLQAGPQIGFLMSATDEYDFDGESGEEDVKDFLKGTDFGINLGAGYEFPGGFGIDATYNLGLTNIADSPDLSDVNWKHGVIQLRLSYAFDLGGSKNDD
jgi:Outer membrane protein beta-barrel domain